MVSAYDYAAYSFAGASVRLWPEPKTDTRENAGGFKEGSY